jgi:hypothetical protein
MDEENCGTNGGCMWMCSDVETVQTPSKPLVCSISVGFD